MPLPANLSLNVSLMTRAAREETRDHHKRHNQKSNRDHRLWNGERNIGCLASLVECHKLSDHRPSENNEDDCGEKKNEFRKKIERYANIFRHETIYDVHADMSAGPSDDAAAKEYAAYHQK